MEFVSEGVREIVIQKIEKLCKIFRRVHGGSKEALSDVASSVVAKVQEQKQVASDTRSINE